MNDDTLKIIPLAPLIWLVCIVYGSLIPFHIRPVVFSDALILFRQIPLLNLEAGSRADWVANILLYTPLGFLLSGAVFSKSTSVLKNSLLSGAVFFSCLLVALLVEFFQIFFSPRTVSLNDLIAETIGSLAGVFLWQACGQKLLKTWQVLTCKSRPESGLTAMFVFYVIFLISIALFPFDFLISIQEIHKKFQTWKTQPFLDSGFVFWLKIPVEAMLFIPLGGYIGLKLRHVSLKRKMIFTLTVALIISFLIEFLQFFLVSGISQPFSVLVKGAGAFAGLLITKIPMNRYGVFFKPFAGLLAAGAMPLYLIICLRLNGWGVSGWINVRSAISSFEFHMLIPFYFHYFTTETRAVLSLILSFGLYVPIGMVGWILRFRLSLSVFIAVGLAFAVESGKLFQAGLHPDFTNILVAGVSVITGFKLLGYFLPVLSQLYNE